MVCELGSQSYFVDKQKNGYIVDKQKALYFAFAEIERNKNEPQAFVLAELKLGHNN